MVLKDMVEYKVNGKSKINASLEKIKAELTSQLGNEGIRTEFVSDFIEEKSLLKKNVREFLLMYNVDHRSDYLYYAFCYENGQTTIYVGGNTPMAEYLKSKAELKSSGKSFAEVSDAYEESSIAGRLVFGGVAGIKQVKNAVGVVHGATKTVFSKKSSREEEQNYCNKVDSILNKIIIGW